MCRPAPLQYGIYGPPSRLRGCTCRLRDQIRVVLRSDRATKLLFTHWMLDRNLSSPKREWALCYVLPKTICVCNFSTTLPACLRTSEVEELQL